MIELFLKIVNMSISASWLLLAVLLLRLILKKAPKWVSVLLWGVVAFRLVCPFSFESVLSLIPSAETISPDIMMDWTPEISTGIQSIDTVINPFITQTFAPDPMTSANPLQILIPVLGNLWILGILIMLIYAAVSYALLRRKVATAVLLKNNIFQSDYVDSPFVLGIFRPKIYLPFQMDAGNMVHVITHEQAHIRRKDHWWKPLGFLLLALHWFNPLMWLGYILLCRDIELACDEKVIREMDSENRANYTATLVACSIHRRRIAVCPLAFGEVGIKERVKSVMNYKKPAFWVIVTAIVACAAVAVCFLTNPKTNQNNDFSGPLEIQPGETYQFVGTVLEVHDTYLMVAPEGGSLLSYTDKVEVPLGDLEVSPMPQVGESALIVYDGYVQEVYPPRISTVYRVDLLYLDSGPIETVYGNVKTYFRNTNGTWQVGGRNYKYRLTITGRMPNAAQDTTFVYLSNIPSISFEQAWRAAGGSSNSEDYFSVEDAILVEWSNVIPGGEVENTYLIPVTLTKVSNDKLSWAGFDGGAVLYTRALNSEVYKPTNVQHLPIFVFHSKEQLNEFISDECKDLTINQSYEEVPAFTDTAASYDDAFFEKNALVLVYVTSENCSYRYTANHIQIHGEAFALRVEEFTKQENNNSEKGGWFVTVPVPKHMIEDCTQFDAYLLEYT